MLAQVSPKVRADVAFYVEDYGAGVSLYDYILAKQQKSFPRLLPTYEQSQPSWTEEQRIAAGTQHLMGGQPLLCRGIAKRITDDDPAELARSASLYARLRLWWGTRDEYDCFLNFSNEMLYALAAGDTFVIERFAAVTPNVATSGPWAERLLHNGIIAVIQRDEELLASAVDEIDLWTKPKCFIECVYTSLRGLLNRDEQLVCDGITRFLKNSRRMRPLYEIFKVISLESHGLYELCRWYEPDLVTGFDVDQGLPWDRGLSAWVRQSTETHPCHDVSALSPTLQEWLTKLPIQDGLRHDWV